MKIEHLIVQHLYKNKTVTLQGIGTIKLNPSVILPAENEKEKDFVMPENAFEFEYNLKAQEDESLIKFIVQHTNKILPLATSDLDSYAILAKQFLNIGKPLVIEGVGTIQKNQTGIYQFTPGHFVTPRIDDIPKQAKEKVEEPISFETLPTPNNSRRNLVIILTIFIVAIGGLALYYLLTRPATEPEQITAVAPVVDTSVKKDTPVIDTSHHTFVDTVSIATAPPVVKTDSSNFKIVLKSYATEESAQKAFKRLSTYGHKLVIIKIDSANYQLAMPFATPVSDTARALDSLRRFFGGKPFVKL